MAELPSKGATVPASQAVGLGHFLVVQGHEYFLLYGKRSTLLYDIWDEA